MDDEILPPAYAGGTDFFGDLASGLYRLREQVAERSSHVMAVWNDTDSPLAFFISFRTYGTWLHGDDRGSIDRYHNTFGGPRVPANATLHDQQRAKLKSKPFILDAKARTIIKVAIREVCEFRKWNLKAIDVRTNHAHLVVPNYNILPDRMLRDFKAYSTRALKKENLWNYDHSPWSDGGSKRYLWTEDQIWYACDYVLNGQGDRLPESFDENGVE
jgi:Transposase and inactivated derivatives